MGSSYRIDGFDDFFEELKDMEISDAKQRKVLKKVGDILIDGIGPNLPKRTGRYRKELKKTIKRFEGNLSVIVNSSRFYDIFQEYGTSQQKSNVGSFEKGVNQSADNAIQAVIKELGE